MCAPLRRIKDASAARRREVFKHRTTPKVGVGPWWNGKLSGQDAAMPKGDRE